MLSKRCVLNRIPGLKVALIVLGLAGRFTCLAEDQKGNSAPHIQFHERAFEFGVVVCGEIVKHDYAFTNTGGRLLLIQDVKTSCGCTTAKNWSREVPPGKTGIIPLELYTVNFTGPVAKSLTVVCNDPDQPMVTLEVKGSVRRPIELIPQAANFGGRFDSLSNICKTIRIVNREEQPLTLSAPVSAHSAIEAELKTNQPGREYELLVRLVGPLGGGNLIGEVSVKTSNPQMPVLKVPVFALAQPGVMVLPTELEIPGQNGTGRLTRTVSIRNNSTNPLKLFEPTINSKGVDLNLEELRPGQFFSIVLRFPEGFQATKGERLELSIKSNNPKFELLKVPILVR
jgi:hypothetical protein